ncbi:MAG: recombinase family protein [Lachnospiraceae bacterium]|nr:recombinase family protein [Lachnospiraceae bacterium]
MVIINIDVKTTKACGYFRLSREDGDKLESDSIKNQKLLVNEFAKKNGIKLVDEYIDDGYSGTNFNRPAFTRFINDVQEGKVNCIIVKDLSRLGRNYIEMGRFISKIFPSLGIRLIAINDNYDSFDDTNSTNQIIVPFKNLINDAYCRDMSLKIRSQLDMKRRKGEFIGSFATYGYMKDPDDHNHLIIDETAAKVVEMIFNMKLDGYSNARIVEKLEEMDIPTPLEYKRIQGFNYNSGFRSKTNAVWSLSSVFRILHNEIYTGTMIQGKRRKVNYKVKQVIDMNEQDWIKVENTHDAIVPKELFDSVQKIMHEDTRIAPTKDNVYILSGITKCATCGQNMVRRVSPRNGKNFYYYHCTTYKKYRTCTSHLISEPKLYESVLKSIQVTLSFLGDAYDLLKDMKERPKDVIGIKLLDKQIEAEYREIEKYKNLKVRLYMDMTDGIITKDEFDDINGDFTTKIDLLRNALQTNEKEKERKLSLNVNEIPWIKEFLKYKNVQKLDRRMVVFLIESVVVYDKNHIEVNFHHKEEIEELIALAMSSKEMII